MIDNADDPATGAAYYNQKSADAVTTYIQQKKPNYAVHLGDLVSGEVAKDANEVSAAVKQILTPIVNAGIPFSTTKGNVSFMNRGGDMVDSRVFEGGQKNNVR